jgi:hypothetical protein
VPTASSAKESDWCSNFDNENVQSFGAERKNAQQKLKEKKSNGVKQIHIAGSSVMIESRKKWGLEITHTS